MNGRCAPILPPADPSVGPVPRVAPEPSSDAWRAILATAVETVRPPRRDR